MTEFEQETEHFFEHLKALGYVKVVPCEQCKWNPMTHPDRAMHHTFQWCWHNDQIGFCQKGEKG